MNNYSRQMAIQWGEYEDTPNGTPNLVPLCFGQGEDPHRPHQPQLRN